MKTIVSKNKKAKAVLTPILFAALLATLLLSSASAKKERLAEVPATPATVVATGSGQACTQLLPSFLTFLQLGE